MFTERYWLNVQRSSGRLITISLTILHTRNTIPARSFYCYIANRNITYVSSRTKTRSWTQRCHLLSATVIKYYKQYLKMLAGWPPNLRRSLRLFAAVCHAININLLSLYKWTLSLCSTVFHSWDNLNAFRLATILCSVTTHILHQSLCLSFPTTNTDNLQQYRHIVCKPSHVCNLCVLSPYHPAVNFEITSCRRQISNSYWVYEIPCISRNSPHYRQSLCLCLVPAESCQTPDLFL